MSFCFALYELSFLYLQYQRAVFRTQWVGMELGTLHRWGRPSRAAHCQTLCISWFKTRIKHDISQMEATVRSEPVHEHWWEIKEMLWSMETNPYADDLNSLWNHLIQSQCFDSLLQSYGTICPSANNMWNMIYCIYFFKVNSFRNLKSAKRIKFYFSASPFCRPEARLRNNCFFFRLGGFFPTLSWQARLKLMSISHSSYHDGNPGLAGRDRLLAAHRNSQTNNICIYNCL